MKLLLEKLFSSIQCVSSYDYATAAAFAALNTKHIDKFETKKTRREETIRRKTMKWEVRKSTKKKTMKTNFKLKIEEAIQSAYADTYMHGMGF